MNATELVKTFITDLQSGDMETAAPYMSDDFVLRGWTSYSLDKGQFLAVQSALLNAMPDYSYNLSDLQVNDHSVEAFIRITGTHTNELSFPLPDHLPIPTTGLTIA